MEICCTKALQNEMGIRAEESIEERNLFCWSVHIITVNRRKTIVAVNDSSRFGFVLYGIKAKDIKNIKEVLIQGIRTCLSKEKIKEEIIERYLEEAGALTFVKTRGPKYVSRLNKACELVRIYEDRVTEEALYQSELARIINDDLIKVDKQQDYDYPCELIIKDLEEFAGESVISCKAVSLMVKLNLGRHRVWRRIITPVDITFKQLHNILQVAFNWKDYHLYDFIISNKDNSCFINVISEEAEFYDNGRGCKILFDSDTMLSEYASKEYNIIYRYDFGDNWQHEITIEGINEEYNANYPVCTMGEGKTPPEDVGGIAGYEEFLKVIKNPDHKEYKTVSQWAESQGYSDLDMDFIGRILKYVLKR